MENQNQENKNEKTEKLTTEKFFSQLKTLLIQAPEDVVLFINATENPDSGNAIGNAIFSLQGTEKHIVYALTRSYEHDRRIKEVGLKSVSIQKMMDSIKDKDPFSVLSGLGGLSALAEILKK